MMIDVYMLDKENHVDKDADNPNTEASRAYRQLLTRSLESMTSYDR